MHSSMPAGRDTGRAARLSSRAAKRVAAAFALLQEYAHDQHGVNLPGLGFLLRRVRHDFFIHLKGQRLFFDHRIAGTYSRLIAGRWNEPETHAFLSRVASLSAEPIWFVDVGANVGEMVLDLAAQQGVERVVAFEPHPICAEVLRTSCAASALRNVTVIQQAVADRSGTCPFSADPHRAFLGRLAQPRDRDVLDVQVTTLDEFFVDCPRPCVLLIDVEGAELRVLQGARRLIQKVRPLIVFEHHATSAAATSLEDFRELLGPTYDLYRLRRDALLDTDFSRTWNCVAVAQEGPLPTKLLKALITGAGGS